MNDVMKLLRQISDICQIKRCMECEFCSENTGMCVFADMPIFWNHEEIENALSEHMDAKMGKWEFYKNHGIFDIYKCSVCGTPFNLPMDIVASSVFCFCPHCGAKMDGK